MKKNILWQPKNILYTTKFITNAVGIETVIDLD